MTVLKKIGIFALLMLMIIACSRQNTLEKHFDCGSASFDKKTKKYDFHKNFSLDVPDHWQARYHYASAVSEIFLADTTKQFTETFIFNASFHNAALEFNASFHKNLDSVLRVNDLELVESHKTTFMEKESYWYLVKGQKYGYPMHQFNLMMKNSAATFFLTSTEIFGEEAVYERLCESVSLLKTIDFLE